MYEIPGFVMMKPLQGLCVILTICASMSETPPGLNFSQTLFSLCNSLLL